MAGCAVTFRPSRKGDFGTGLWERFADRSWGPVDTLSAIFFVALRTRIFSRGFPLTCNLASAQEDSELEPITCQHRKIRTFVGLVNILARGSDARKTPPKTTACL